jgi:hypothetical protein
MVVMKKLILVALLFSLALAQGASRVLNQSMPITGATNIKGPEERVLRALAVTEGRRCQFFEGWAFAKTSTAGEYSKLIENFNESIQKAGWKLESKGNLSQGGSNVEAFKLTGVKNELVLGYWLLANNQSQLLWCRLG